MISRHTLVLRLTGRPVVGDEFENSCGEGGDRNSRFRLVL